MLDQTVRDREIDPKKYYPPDLYREPQPDFPRGLHDRCPRVWPRKRLRHMQEKLAAKQDQLDKVVAALEQES